MSIKRFWGKGAAVNEWVALSKEEISHVKVARVRENEAVEILDGEGNFWRGTFEKNGVRVKETGHKKHEGRSFVLAIGVTQGGTMDDIVRQASEMGVVEIIPVKSKNSAPLSDRETSKHERWQRIADEACKQCGRYWRPIVWPATTLAEVLKKTSNENYLVAALVEPITPWDKLSLKTDKTIIWIGPEGDFTSLEYEELQAAGAQFVTLGHTVLRAETACVAALARATLLS